MNMIDTVIKPMHPEGRPFLLGAAVLTLILFLAFGAVGWLGVGLTVWCYYFFRDPPRSVPLREGLVVSPADGVVSMIGPAIPPAELGLPAVPLTRVSVFMNVFDCHVNRAPVPGRVIRRAYRPGRFLNASLDKASEDNERMAYAIGMADGRIVVVVQIAGLVARRIVSFADEGRVLAVGERFGLIRFGSRVDVYLPEGVEPLVAVGQTMIAGETVLADMASDEPRRQARRD
ncbi:phosphatidylserine decarboxylase precursor-related protein [Rubellimicrobium thermophilum DSM 16684]|uniref:Phosphatidylserine decarboxylase proenzyme n=1 Tax=Rubellimicrobium thermophilum DSM 16684 TaxID=1123069 RepID=S9QWV7_9RHOB|nr:phosphatidylserine decarboxylase [Rubellimicrobium thermophilum]EPX85891.1 phosphatidylserine decarboxylase precursor-related protein [Rubellimicrobium thermophilum DSM 16684]